MVTANTLIEGVWFAMEQAGRLLRSAVHLYDVGDYASGVALAMFAHEELGRSRILLDVAEDVNRGDAIGIQELRKICNDHLEKQRRGAFSVTYRGNSGEPLADALNAMMQSAPGSREYEAAQQAVDKAVEGIAVTQPLERHGERMSAVYLDLEADGRTWSRPGSIEPAAAFDRICGAVNDYSVGKQWFEEPLLSTEDERLHARNPKARLLRMAKPPGLSLPPAQWPRMPP